MNRKILLLNLALVALAAVLVWQIRLRWRDSQQHATEVLAKAAKAQPVLLPPAPETPKPVTPADYLDVAQKTLFARDRNPIVTVDPPPPPPAPPPPKPMPPLPFYYGQMTIGEPVVVLGFVPDDQKGYHAGEAAGVFKVIAFDRESITFEWEDKTVERKLVELRPKEPTVAQQSSSSTGGASANSSPPSTATVIKSLSPSPAGASSTNSKEEPQAGIDVGGGFRSCAPGDNSPAGTILNGYRKVITRGVVGSACTWEQVK